MTYVENRQSLDPLQGERIGSSDPRQFRNAPCPRYPGRLKSRLMAVAYAALDRCRTIPDGSLLERETRRKRWAAHEIIPRFLMPQLSSGDLALLAVIALNAEGGRVEYSNYELACLTGMNGRNVQRRGQRLQERGIIQIEHRDVPGAKHLVNVYTIISTAFLQWLGRIRSKIIGWRKRHGSKKEIGISLKPMPKTAPKTLDDAEAALRSAQPGTLTAHLLALLAEAKKKKGIR